MRQVPTWLPTEPPALRSLSQGGVFKPQDGKEPPPQDTGKGWLRVANLFSAHQDILGDYGLQLEFLHLSKQPAFGIQNVQSNKETMS